MDDLVSLTQLAAELGLDRASARECVRRSGVRPRKVRTDGTGDRVAVVISGAEADRIRSSWRHLTHPPPRPGRRGYFLAARLVPDLDPRRLKLGFARTAAAWAAHFAVAAPTAVILRSWPCRAGWERAVIDCLTARGCSLVAGDVFTCDDVDALVSQADALLALLADGKAPAAPAGDASRDVAGR